ncbi:MAG: NUDIX hydrolase [Treponema sp.]|nr:NUDIX hydrolase [Treponema sp.]
METSHLIWTEEKREERYRTGVMSLYDVECRSPEGKLRTFSVIDCPDWVNIIPVVEGPKGRQFLMVHQWRYGSAELSVEFPGGIIEEGETPEAGAERELQEETAFRAGRLIKLGSVRPNPAIMSNTVHFYLAENLIPLPRQNLDEDEFVDVMRIDEKEVIANMGKPPYIHSLSVAALAFFLKRPK